MCSVQSLGKVGWYQIWSKKKLAIILKIRRKINLNDKNSMSLGFKTEFKSDRLQKINPSKSFNDDVDTLELSKVLSHVKNMMNSTRTFNYVNDFTSQNLAVQSSNRDLNGRWDNYRTLKALDRSMNTSQNSSALSDYEANHYSPTFSEKSKINK